MYGGGRNVISSDGVCYKEHAAFGFVFAVVEGFVKHSEKIFNIEVFRQDLVYNFSYFFPVVFSTLLF